LLEDATLRQEIGANGQRFIQANFSWEIFAARVEAVLAALRRRAAEDGPEPRPMPVTRGR
jgi:glycosyltransferase involved in cell wall biosynthesis